MGRPIYGDETTIRMRRGTFLVLYDALERTLHTPDARREVTPGNFEIVFHIDEAERRALNWLAGAIESGVTEVHADEKTDMIVEHKRWIMSRHK